MGKKYRILICGNEAGRVEHNDIVELEEVEENPAVVCSFCGRVNPYGQTCCCILAEYVKRKTEGLVRIDDVLKVFDKAMEEWNARNTVLTRSEYIRKAIEGMKHGK